MIDPKLDGRNGRKADPNRKVKIPGKPDPTRPDTSLTRKIYEKPRNVADDGSRGANSLTPAQHNLVLRYYKAMQYRIRGNSYTEVAEAMRADPDVLVSPKYDARAAYFDVQGYLNELRSAVQDNLIDFVDLEAQRLDALTNAFWESAMAGDVRAGRMVLDIMERRAKMLGLDQAIKVDWRIELRQIERSGVLSDVEIREQLGDDLYSMYRQFSEEKFAESESPMQHLLVDKVRHPNDYPKQGAAQFAEFLDVRADAHASDGVFSIVDERIAD